MGRFVLTGAARRALVGARVVAGATNASAVQPAHILAAILEQRSTRLSRLLTQLRCDTTELGTAVEAVTGPRTGDSADQDQKLAYSGASKHVIVRAQKEARAQRSREFDVEDLLLALTLDRDQTAADLLSEHGVTADRLRAARKKPEE